MYDILEIINNIDTLYNSNNALSILKDFERVIDDLDLYVFENWSDGELIEGPLVERHWVTCKFMWPAKHMPNPNGAKRLTEYGCEVTYKKDVLIKPRKIRTPDDIRPNSKKGKLDEHPIWIVTIMMPKKLILDVFRGYHDQLLDELEPENDIAAKTVTTQEPEQQAMQMEQPAFGGPAPGAVPGLGM